ncbi:MAG: hypothetical protein AAF417_10390 [Pseudomonadota bacterium]
MRTLGSLAILAVVSGAAIAQDADEEPELDQSLVDEVAAAIFPDDDFEALSEEDQERLRVVARRMLTSYLETEPVSSAFMRPLSCGALVTRLIYKDVCDYALRTGRTPYEFNGEIYYMGRPGT